jgi:hypothetical protein
VHPAFPSLDVQRSDYTFVAFSLDRYDHEKFSGYRSGTPSFSTKAPVVASQCAHLLQ